MPCLKWIICGSHGYDNVSLRPMVKNTSHQILTQILFEVAEWICEKVIGDKVLLLGGGRIGKKVIVDKCIIKDICM